MHTNTHTLTNTFTYTCTHTYTKTGTPTGTVTIKARNWRDILALATASGALPAALTDQIEQGLSLLANFSGNPETLDIPLTFSGGYIKIGLIPVAPAPRLSIR